MEKKLTEWEQTYTVTLTKREIETILVALEVDIGVVANDDFVPVEKEYKRRDVELDVQAYNTLADAYGCEYINKHTVEEFIRG